MTGKPKRKQGHHVDPRAVFGRNLTRLVEADGRTEGEIGIALRLGSTPGIAASNLRQYMAGERLPGNDKLAEFRAVLGVALEDFFVEGA